MDKIKVIHDTVGQTLTVWLDDPSLEYVCEETNEEVILMKDKDGHVIGFEKLHYTPSNPQKRLAVETVVQTGT